jgi:transposase
MLPGSATGGCQDFPSPEFVCAPFINKRVAIWWRRAAGPAVKLLRQIPSIVPVRGALLVAVLQTPHRFPTKGQLCAYSGFAIETHDSGEYPYVSGSCWQPGTHQRARVE